MPGFYGLINKNSSKQLGDDKFNIISDNIFLNKWCSKSNIKFFISDMQILLGITSLHQDLTRIQPPANTFPEIFFEGYIYEIKGVPTIPEDYGVLRGLLNDLYLKYEEELFKRLCGSFSMVIITLESLSLVTDHSCSRPIYFFQSDGYLAWCPEIFPLLKAFKKDLSVNIRNLGQILCSEFSFIDDTIVNEIISLRPGEILTLKEGKIRRRNYFKFSYHENHYKSGLFTGKKIAKALNNRIKEVISKQWAMAQSPAIMLSGGLDSRYVVSAIADIVDDTSKLTLVTWTVAGSGKYSDLDIASKIAKRLGSKHIVLQREVDGIISELDKTFRLIGCEVDSFFHVNERILIELLREKYGIESLFRGEEAFGWGEYRRNIKYALNQIIVSYPEDNPLINKIIRPKIYREIYQSWHLKLGEILREYEQRSINDLKDSLYFNWRLARYLNTLSYFKLAYMEQYNPLLDQDIIGINSYIPSNLRVDKKIFRIAYREKGCTLKDLPYATRSSLEDWERVLHDNKEIFNYLIGKHGMKDNLFENSEEILTDHFDKLILKRAGTGKNFFADLNYVPFIKQNPIFKALNKLRHLYVKHPPETVPIKFLFRTAIVKDFLHKYLY